MILSNIILALDDDNPGAKMFYTDSNFLGFSIPYLMCTPKVMANSVIGILKV